MKEYSIKDQLFSHAFSSSNWFKPTDFKWNFNEIITDFIFLTDHNIYEVEKYKNMGLKVYAWLVESPEVTKDAYKFILENGDKFDKIFTFNKDILNKYSHSLLLPIGGCHLDENEISLDYEKNKLISLMISNKKFASGHNIRYQIYNELRHGYNIDFMGSAFGGHVKKINSVKDYMFSITVENTKKDFYFTEKIIDVFLSGTIPIYWGCPSIGKFFNTEGFFTFDNMNELKEIIKDKDKLIEFYNSKKEIIEENYSTALKYKIAEDYLYNNYDNIL